MIETPNAGTACAHCKDAANHYCRATVVSNGVPLCDACFNGEQCEAMQAHHRRIHGVEVPEGGIVPPVKTLSVSRAQREPVTDVPWVSDWRKSLKLDAKNIEPMKRVRPIASRPEPRRSTRRTCDFCEAKIRRENTTGRCGAHRDHKVEGKTAEQCHYQGCEKTLRQHNTNGLCKHHQHKLRHLIQQKCVRTCDDCGVTILPRNRLPLCCKCSKSTYQREYKERHLGVAA